MIIFHHEDPFLAFKRTRESLRFFDDLNSFLNSWKVDLNCCSLAQFAQNGDAPTALDYRPIHSCQAQSCSFASLLGGEEWFEDMQPRLFVHPLPTIMHRQHDVRAGSNLWITTGAVLV